MGPPIEYHLTEGIINVFCYVSTLFLGLDYMGNLGRIRPRKGFLTGWASRIPSKIGADPNWIEMVDKSPFFINIFPRRGQLERSCQNRGTYETARLLFYPSYHDAWFGCGFRISGFVCKDEFIFSIWR